MPESRSNKNIRTQLKSMATWGGRVTSSTARMFLASGKELFSNSMPTLVDTVQVNTELMADVVQVLRNPADAVNKQINRVMETEDAKSIMRFARNALDDLKSGNLYDPNRDRNSASAYIDDLMDNFAGVDFSGFDENGDWSEPDVDGFDQLEAEAGIADVQEENASKRTAATIDAIGTSTEAITSTINAGTQASIRSGIKQHAQVMTALNNSLSVQSATLSAIDTSIKGALEVTREAHNQIMGKMDEITGLLTEIRDGIRPPQVKKEYKDPNSVFGNYGGLDIKRYLAQVVKNIDERYQIGSLSNIATGGMSITDLIGLIGDNPWKLLTDQAIGFLAKKTGLKAQMERTDTNFRNFLPALLESLSARYDRKPHGKERTIQDEILSLFGVKSKSRTSIDTQIDDYNKQAVFTKRTTTAIEQVIPHLLSQINSSISGQPLMVYNYKTGKFERARDTIARYIHRSTDLVGGMTSANEFIEMAGKLNWKTTKDREDFQDYLYRFFQGRAASGTNRFINPYMPEEEFKELMPSDGRKELYYKIIRGMFDSMDRSMIMQMSSDILESRATRDRRNFELNQDLQDSGLIAAFSGLIDDRLQKSIEGKIVRGVRGGLSTDALDNLERDKRMEAMRSGGVQASNYLLNDILGVLKKGILTYSYVIADADAKGDDGRPVYPGLADGLKYVLRDRESRENLDVKVSEYFRRHKTTEVRRSKSEIDAYYDRVEKGLANTNFNDAYIDINKNIGVDDVRMMMAHARAKETAKDESGSLLVEWIRQREDDLRGNINQVIRSTDTKDTFSKIVKLVNSPFQFMNETLKLVDAFMFKIIYGEDAMLDIANGATPSLMNTVTNTVKGLMTDAKSWFVKEVGDPIKGIMFDMDHGIVPRVLRRGWDMTEGVRTAAKDKIKGVRDSLIGTKTTDEDGTTRYTGGKFSSVLNKLQGKTEDGADAVTSSIKGAVNRLLYGDYIYSKGKLQTDFSVDPQGNVVPNRSVQYGGVIGRLRQGFDKVNYYLFGDESDEDPDIAAASKDSRKKWKMMTREVKKAAPDMIIGGGLGILGSMFLPGGPLLGGLVGSFAGLINGSERFKEYLFGEFAEEDRQVYDIKTGQMVTKKVKTRKGGIFTQTVYDGVKQYAPKITAGALAGAAAGGLGLLPFGMGPMIGGVLGSIGGMTAASNQLKRMIFGDSIDPKSGLISRDFRDKVTATIKKYAPASIGGALAGNAVWNLGIGLIPGLSLLPGGPIFTMLGSLAAASNAETINKFFFGEEYVEETTDKATGKTTKVKKRKGGLFGSIFDAAKSKVLEPFANRVNKLGEDIQVWFKDNVVGPFGRAIEPMKQQIGDGLKRAGASLLNIGKTITDGIKEALNISVDKTIGSFLREKVVEPLNRLTNRIFSAIGRAIGTVVSAPFKALELIFTGRTVSSERSDGGFFRRSTGRRVRQEGRRVGDRLRHVADRFRKRDERVSAPFTPSGGPGPDLSDIDPSKIAIPLGAGEYGNITYEGQSYTDGDPEFYGYGSTSSGYDEYQEGGDQGYRRGGIRYNMDRRRERRESRHERIRKNQEERNKRRQEKDEKLREKREARSTRARSTDESRYGNAPDPETGERSNKRKYKGRSPEENLGVIARYTRKIFDEINGQVNGVGWNTAYIKTLLELQFGGLSDDQLPEEMEGSKKIKKRRGFFGKARDAIFGFGGMLRDKATEKLRWVRDKLDWIFEPIHLLMDAVGTAKDFILAAGKKLAHGVGALVDKLGSMVLGAIDTIGKMTSDALLTVTGAIKGAAEGIGHALGNIADTVTGVLGDFALTASGIMTGLIRTAVDIAPDVFKGAWEFGKFLGKGAVKVAKGVGRVIGGGVSKLWHKITGRGGDHTSSKFMGITSVDGGYLDSITKVTRVEDVRIGSGKITWPLPYVAYANGKAFYRSSHHALQVYLVGADTGATIHTITSGDQYGSPSDEKASNLYRRAYSQVDVRAERAKNPADVYDRAIRSAGSQIEIMAIRDAQQMNANAMALTSGAAQTSGDATSGSALGAIGDLLSRGKGSILSILAKYALPLLGQVIPALAISYGIGTPGEEHVAVRGAEVSILKLLKRAGLGKISANTLIEAIKNPKVLQDAASAANMMGKTDLAGRLTRTSGMMGKAKSLFDAFASKFAKKGAANAASTGTLALGEGTARAAAGSSAKGVIGKAVSSILDKILNNKVVRAMAGTLIKKLAPIKGKIISLLTGTALDKAIQMSGKEALEQVLRTAGGYATAGLVTAGFAIIDFTTGWNDAYKIFGVHTSQVTLGMKVTSALYRAISGALAMLPPPVVGNVASIALSFAEDQLVNLIYSVVASEESVEQLRNNQKTVSNNAAAAGMSVNEYVKNYDEEGNERKGFFATLLEKGAQLASSRMGFGSGYGTGRVTPMSQRAGKYNRYNDNMSLAGCGPTVAAMVGSAYGDRRTPLEADYLSRRMGMRASDGGTNPAFFSQYAGTFGAGYGMKEGPTSPLAIESSLSNGRPVVLMGRGGKFGSHMHYLVADGMSGKGKMSFVDPMSGSRKSASIGEMVQNTKSTVYSWGTGPADGAQASTSEAQNALVNKMKWLQQNPIAYSQGGSQDPDKGSASCASTVGWAYRKVLGITGMSASSEAQSKDNRFTDIVRLGQPGKAPGKTFDLSLLQPGDIVYMRNPGTNHTEMYIGGGKDLSHGGPGAGPTERTLDETRQKKVFAVRRYKPFVTGDTVTLTDTSSNTTGSDGSTSGNTDLMSVWNNSAAGKFMSGLSSIFNNEFTNRINSVLGTVGASLGFASGDDSSSSSSAGNTSYSSDSAGSPSEQKKKNWKFLIDNGFTPIAAAGIMGCWNSESGNRSDRVEGDYLKSFPGFSKVLENNQTLNDYTQNVLFKAYDRDGLKYNSSGYKGTDGNYYPGIGLAQWTGPRGYNLFKFAKDTGTDWRDQNTQLKFFLNEVNGSKKAMFNAAKTVDEATNLVLDNYEMNSKGFGSRNPSMLNERIAAANSIYNTYSGMNLSDDEFGTGGNVRNMLTRYGKKSNKLRFSIPSFGTGNGDANRSAMNDRIRKINNVLASTANETPESDADKIVAGIKDVIQTSGGSNESIAVLQTIAGTLSAMLEVLNQIKSNTTPPSDNISSGQGNSGRKPANVSTNPYASLPIAEGTNPAYDGTGYQTSQKIIDALTRK